MTNNELEIYECMENFEDLLLLDKEPKIYAYFKHENTLKKAFKDISPYAQFFLSNFALQHWCLQKRKEINLDLNELLKNRIYVGVNQKHTPLYLQAEVLIVTEDAIKHTESYIKHTTHLTKEEKESLLETFFNIKSNINKNRFSTVLQNAVLVLIQDNEKYFKNIYRKTKKIFKSLDDEISSVYHSSDLIIEAYAYYKKQNKELFYFNRQIENIFKTFGDYPFEKDMTVVLNETIEGNVVAKIAEKMDKSFKYVATRYEKIKETLNVFLFGFYY